MYGTPPPKSSREEMRTEARHYFRCCPDLDLWSVGNTPAEAEAALNQEILNLLKQCSKYVGTVIPRGEHTYRTFEVRPWHSSSA
jgi:hypothetical protein